MQSESPFQTKSKLECTCESCNSSYKIVFFEEETFSEMRYCPFCGEEIDEMQSYNKKIQKEENGVLYTDDDGVRYENELIDDDEF